MKTLLYSALFVAAGQNLRAQVPIMNPISGQGIACSVPAQPLTYSASASNSPTQFYWSVLPGTGVTYNNTGSTSTVSFPKGSGTYTIYCYATNAQGSSVPVSKVVTVYEMPTVTFSGAMSFCQGSSTHLMASPTMLSGSSTLNYYWTPAAGLNNQASPSVIASPSVSTNYTLLVSNGYCQNSYSVPVTVHALPQFSISFSKNPICKGEVALVSFSGNALNYAVNGSSLSGTSVSLSPTSTTSYSVKGTDQNGCETSMSFTQNVDLCLAIQNAQKLSGGLRVYPNPSNGIVYLKADAASEARVINQLGEQILKVELQPGEEMPLTGLASGVYFVVTPTTAMRVIVTR